MRHFSLTLAALILAQPAFAAPKWDANGDGKMTKDEFVSMLSARMVKRLDANRDGRISLDEWNARPDALRAKSEGKSGAEKRFARLDENNDGFLVAADFVPRLEKRFDRMDTDKDGALSRQERKAFRAAHHKNG